MDNFLFNTLLNIRPIGPLHSFCHFYSVLTFDFPTMLFKILLLAAALQTFSVYAKIGNAVLANRCPYDVWIQHINGQVSK